MANTTLRERQAQYKSCPQNVYLIPSQTAVSIGKILIEVGGHCPPSQVISELEIMLKR